MEEKTEAVIVVEYEAVVGSRVLVVLMVDVTMADEAGDLVGLLVVRMVVATVVKEAVVARKGAVAVETVEAARVEVEKGLRRRLLSLWEKWCPPHSLVMRLLSYHLRFRC